MYARDLRNGMTIADERIVSNDGTGVVDEVGIMRRFRPGKVRVWLESGQPLIMDEYTDVTVVQA